jgi:peptide/nickel transport system substrate-binding protein
MNRLNALLLAFVFMLVACKGPQNETAAPSKASIEIPADLAKELYDIKPLEPGVDGDWQIQMLPAEPQILNPLLDTADAYTARITYARQDIFESLLKRDSTTIEYGPSLAESWKISDDHLTYTFNLNKNVKFSDGVALTAKDVKFTFETILNPQNETADLRNYFQDITSIETPDDFTVVIHCKKPYFLHLGTFGDSPILPQHIYGTGDFNTHENNRKPIGSGPYVFDSWTTGQQLVLKRNDNYWNKEHLPHLLRYVYRFITDDEPAMQALLKGEIDVMGLTPEQWVNRTGTPEFTEHFDKKKYYGFSGYIGDIGYIGWNMRKPMFSDKRVRRALTMLLDRPTVLKQVYYDLGIVASGSQPITSIDYDHSIQPWPFDPEKAAALLDEAGWSERNSAGVRVKDGQPFTFQIMFPPGNAETNRWTTVYQESLKKAGIDMQIRSIEWATMLEYITNREFEATTLRWAIPPDSDPYQLWHSTQTEKGSNYPGLNNPEVDKLLEDARLEFDPVKRSKMYHRLHAILHEEQPYTFLLSRPILGAFSKRYHNVNVYPLGPDPTDWFVPLALQRYK